MVRLLNALPLRFPAPTVLRVQSKDAAIAAVPSIAENTPPIDTSLILPDIDNPLVCEAVAWPAPMTLV